MLARTRDSTLFLRLHPAYGLFSPMIESGAC